ncbi:unnamed protein product [Lampetra planeri]
MVRPKEVVSVANLACSISNNEEGVKLVRMAATQIDSLCPQVINAALTLAARPQSKVAQDNMDVFKDQWEKQVRILTEAVDDITSVDDFLSVSENHILEDVNKCVIALQEGDVDTLDRTAGAIRGRAARVVHIINAEMENYEPGVYTERVLESIKLLSETAATSTQDISHSCLPFDLVLICPSSLAAHIECGQIYEQAEYGQPRHTTLLCKAEP